MPLESSDVMVRASEEDACDSVMGFALQMGKSDRYKETGHRSSYGCILTVHFAVAPSIYSMACKH